jgi:hypothetical protein
MGKSLLRCPNKLCVDTAKHEHNCQSGGHRVTAGQRRLKVFTDPRSPDHYCVDCGLKIIEADKVRLEQLAADLRAGS